MGQSIAGRSFTVLLVLAVTFCFALAQPVEKFSLDQVSEFFPWRGFETEIAFWKRVFTEYGERDILLHDKRDLGLIYGHLRVPAGFWTDEDEAERQKEHLKRVREELEKRLKEIADWGPDSPRLTQVHRNLVRIVSESGQTVTSERFAELSKNVRYQRGIRERFLEGLVRSGRYIEQIERIFEEHGLPRELAMLPHLESSFDGSARSKVGAVGMWQFMRGTARRYMTVSRSIDDRYDPLIATAAAARYMKKNHEMLGHWPLTLTAYNHGPQSMKRAQRQFGNNFRAIADHYKSRSFGFASRNFYPSYLAVLEVASNYRDYFGEVEIEAPFRYDVVRLKHAYHISHFEKIDLSRELLREFNPRLTSRVWRRSHIIPAGFSLRVPQGSRERVELAMVDFKPSRGQVRVAADGGLRYRVRRGNTLAGIAHRFGTSVSRLLRWNRLSNANRIYVGQMLTVSPAPSTAASRTSSSRYRVKKGDSLASIARRFRVSVRDLLKANRLPNPNRIFPGQVLRIRPTP